MAAETEYAWAAGFLDGEGTIGLYTSKKKLHEATRQPVVQAYQANAAPLERLASLFGGCVRYAHDTDKGTAMHIWRVTGAPAIIACIDAIYPYLSVKQPEADIVRRYCSMMRRGARYSEDEIALRMSIANEFTKLRAA